MFSGRHRLAHGPDASGSDRDAEPRLARRAAIGAADTFWLALIAALVALAASLGAIPSRGLTGSSPDCLFAGKGGVICDSAAAPAAQTIAAKNADRCVSFGKGGRVCPQAK
jgi:hypothetical protein